MSDEAAFAAAVPEIADALGPLIEKHKHIAIPAILSLCVALSVGRGEANKIRGILKRAIMLSIDLEDGQQPETGWKSIPNYVGYEAHPSGLIRSMKRSIMNGGLPRKIRRRLLIQSTNSTTGYPVVGMTGAKGKRTELVSHMIAYTFIGPRPPGMQICHRDGDRSNNSVSNLYYGTPKQNSADTIRHGRSNRGEKSAMAKLTEKDVRYIRENPDGKRQRELATMFCLHPKYVSEIVRGTYWKHL